MADNPISTAPRDRVIEVRTIEDGVWLRVAWDAEAKWFEFIDDDMWVLPRELDAWREAEPAAG